MKGEETHYDKKTISQFWNIVFTTTARKVISFHKKFAINARQIRKAPCKNPVPQTEKNRLVNSTFSASSAQKLLLTSRTVSLLHFRALNSDGAPKYCLLCDPLLAAPTKFHFD